LECYYSFYFFLAPDSTWVVFLALILLNLFFYFQNPTDSIINDNVIGDLYFDGETLILTTNKREVIVKQDFSGELIFRFEGFDGEVEGYGRNPNTYYGTNNQIIVKTGVQKSGFYIFLENRADKSSFYKISSWAIKNKMNEKEYSRGIRTYNGQTLTYKEIQSLKRDN